MKKQLPPKALARHQEEGQLNTKCHRVFVGRGNVNVLLTRFEAIKVAANILRKASLLDDEQLTEEWAVHLWSIKGDWLNVGFAPIKKSPRKKS